MKALPLWRPRLFLFSRNRRLASWLIEPDSLTARCQRACRHFRIQLVNQGMGLPMPDEAALLGIRPGRRAWVREVLLECDGEPVIYGHTVLARQPRGHLTRWLAGLGSHSLGALLFSHPGFARGGIEFRRLDSRDELFRRAVRQGRNGEPRTLWARRSTHSLFGQTVLVTEVFLPRIVFLEERALSR